MVDEFGLPPAEVVAPDVVGLTMRDAHRVALAAHVALAQPDPDGPPLSARTWRQPAILLSQDPPPGTPVPRYASVVATWTPEGTGVREPRRPVPPAVAGAEDGER